MRAKAMAALISGMVAACGSGAPPVEGRWKYSLGYAYEQLAARPFCFLSGELTFPASGPMLRGSLAGIETCSHDGWRDTTVVTMALTGVIASAGAETWSIVLVAEDGSLPHTGELRRGLMRGTVRYRGRFGFGDWSWSACPVPQGADFETYFCGRH